MKKRKGVKEAEKWPVLTFWTRKSLLLRLAHVSHFFLRPPKINSKIYSRTFIKFLI